MDPPQAFNFDQSWSRRRMLMIEQHDNELAHYRVQAEKERQAARDAHERRRAELYENLPSEKLKQYFDYMLQKNLDDELQRIDMAHEDKTRPIKEAQKTERAMHEFTFQEAKKARLEVPATPPELSCPSTSPEHLPPIPVSATPETNSTRQLTKPFTCTILWEVIDGERRLMLRYQAKKRKAPELELESKRLCINASVDSLRTPVATPLVEECQQLPRTITFDEVFQEGRALYKDTIVEWPVGSGKWYILKCEAHGFHFKDRPIQGAAKHLNGKLHGFLDRNWAVAVETLGYLVVDCNEDLAGKNNQVAANAYTNGYKPKHVQARRRNNLLFPATPPPPSEVPTNDVPTREVPTIKVPTIKVPTSEVPTGDADFEISMYSDGNISWNREGETACLKLYHSTDRKMISIVGSPVGVTIDPQALTSYSRESIPDSSDGNSIMTLAFNGDSSNTIRMVFDRTKGSKLGIGKIQARNFIRWVRSVNPEIRFLEI
ncbi:hypothetical protein F5X99DRAFT_344459 [Biscogniauxia marginata]|nr:hypothetical protein F5X99DRAFT_344459 [Biscogniauxia marginata]